MQSPEHGHVKHENVQTRDSEQQQLELKCGVVYVLVRFRHQKHRPAARVDRKADYRKRNETKEIDNRYALEQPEQAQVGYAARSAMPDSAFIHSPSHRKGQRRLNSASGTRAANPSIRRSSATLIPARSPNPIV